MSRPDKMIRINRELLNYISRLHDLESKDYVSSERIRPGQQIISQGKHIFSAYILKEGIAKCYQTEDTGKDFIQEFFGEGEIFGEIEVINSTTSFCCIEAITEVVVYKITQSNFQHLLENDKRFNKLILRALATKINYTALRHSYHQSHPSSANFLKLKKQFPKLTEVISKQDLANYLGITVRSLNRTLGDLQQRDLLD